jgi:hypothetical protein
MLPPCILSGSNFQNAAKPVSNWLEKKLASGIYLQNTRDELQNSELYSARTSVRSSAKALPKALQYLCPPSVLVTQ